MNKTFTDARIRILPGNSDNFLIHDKKKYYSQVYVPGINITKYVRRAKIAKVLFKIDKIKLYDKNFL